MRTLFLFLFGSCILSARIAFAQTPIADTAKHTDSTLSVTPKPIDRYWRRPQAERGGSDIHVTDEAIRYYGSPLTYPLLLEDAGAAFPLVLSEEAYGRESFLITGRTSEAEQSTLLEGLLPMNSLLNGEGITNDYEMEAFDDIRLSVGASGAALTNSDYASSDVSAFRVERFRAPVPYSRVHYTQDLSRSASSFDALFSLNATNAINLAFGLHRRSTGRAFNPYDVSFNPRTDLWGGRAQMNVSKYIGELPQDTALTPHKIDSFYATPYAKERSLDLLVWANYTTVFSGLNGGINPRDSVDIFDQTTAPMLDENAAEHRIRMDGLLHLELPLLAKARTGLGAYYSYESRRITVRDSTFARFIPDVYAGRRLGAMLEQPLTLSIGDFLTLAKVRGDFQRLDRDSTFAFTSPISVTRFAAMVSDSLALRTQFRIALFGFFRTVQSTLKVGNTPADAAVFPSIGAEASIGFSDALSFTTSYQYSRDRAELSPTPTATYQLRNIAGFVDLRFPISSHDSINIHAGILDRNEPEGIVYDIASDTLQQKPRFSNAPFHSQSASLALDAYIHHFHFAGLAGYFPQSTPPSAYALNPALISDLFQRFFGSVGFYYENQVSEGNLRISVGTRLRFLNRLDPQGTYDRASDFYVYRGAAPRGNLLMPSLESPLSDARLNSPKGILDVLLTTEVDRRAQVNMSFLNILSTPYYDVALYPRTGFHWRIDVTWAFLD